MTKMPKEAQAFYQGYVLAMANIIRCHDQPSMVIDIMQNDGVTIGLLKRCHVDAYDLKVIRKAFKDKGVYHAKENI